MVIASILDFFKSSKDVDSLSAAQAKLAAGEAPLIVAATEEDIEFLVASYAKAASEGTVAKTSDVRRFIERCLKVSMRESQHDTHQHPFIVGQPPAWPLDDIFILKIGGVSIGILWLRDYNDHLLAPETFGELIFLWVRPELRRYGCWPYADKFSKNWAQEKKKTFLVGRCLSPSRRMAELFGRSHYKLRGISPKGMTVHLWTPAKKSNRRA